jgi:H+/Cl- antiporter ClcA/predicted transcriptional regulator
MTLTPDPKGLSQPATTPVKPSIFRPFNLFNRLQLTPETVVLLLAILIGTGAGSGVVIFRFLIQVIHRLMLSEMAGVFSIWGHWTLALIPLLGGLIVGLMRWRVKDFGPGLSALMESVQGGRELLPLKPISKMLAAAISLGSGASLGPEGPSVEIGANFSLLLGQVLRVSKERQQLLLSAGAAAGLAAGFNAPIAGVFFALEVVLGTTFATSAVSVVLLAAVVSAWIAQIGLGFKPAFSLPAYEVRSLLELPLYVGLGLLASLISVLYKRLMAFSQQSFQGQVAGLQWLAAIPQPFHPVLGGMIVGLVALQFPQILGVGYETVESMLQDVQFSLYLVLALLVMKLAMTALSFGSGFVGGVFAPALFLGASLGSAYAKILAIAFPMLLPYMASPPAYAMVGMAAVLAGSVRAPLTSILLLFELTQDYRIVLPLMAAVGLSIWLVELLQPTVVLDSDGEQQEPKGDLHQAPEGLSSLNVADVMQASPLQLSGTMELLDAGRSLISHRSHCALVLGQDDQFLGLMTLQDVNRLIANAKPEADLDALMHQPISQLCTTDMLCAYSDESLQEAIARMATRGLHQLPVLSREQPQQVIGLLTQENVTLAYTIARTNEFLHTPMDDPLLEPLEHSSLDAPLDAETINALEIHSVDGDTVTVEATDLDTHVANGSDSSKSNGKTVLPL